MLFQDKNKSMFEHPEQFILDNVGRQYQVCIIIDDERFFYVKLKYREEFVGEAKCSFQSHEEMLLADLIIYEEVIHSSPIWWLALLQKMLNLNKATNYRHQGLGYRLLKIVIKHACQKRVKHIYCSLVKNDIANTPNLVEWYQKQGFKVSEKISINIPDAVATVYMDIS